MHAAFRSVHPATLGSVAVIQKFCREAFQDCPFLCFKYEGWNPCAVLTEIDHQFFPRFHAHRLSCLIFFLHDYLPKCFVALTRNAFPNVCFHGSQGQVFAEINLGSIRRNQLAFKFVIYFRSRKFIRCLIAGKYPGVIFLSVEDGGMSYRSRNTCLPILRIRPEQFFASIRIRQFEHAAKRTFLANHPDVIGRSNNLVAPPPRRNLCRKDILRLGIRIQRGSDVVGERQFRFAIMSKSGLQDFVSD